MQVYIIDENGYYIKPVIIQGDKPVGCVEIQPPDGLYRAKWTGIEWVEDMTQEEIDELNKPQPNIPTFEELQVECNVDLDYRLSLLEMGL